MSGLAKHDHTGDHDGGDDLKVSASAPADESANRAAGTTEVNGTQYARLVTVAAVSAGTAASEADLSIAVDGVTVDSARAQAADTVAAVAVEASVTALVPPGSEYTATVTTGTVSTWTEQAIGQAA